SSSNVILTGDAGVNVIAAGAGNDTITGGAGADILTGGLGADTFVMGAGADLAAGETINGTAEAGTIDTLRLDAAGTYNLSSFTTDRKSDVIAKKANAPCSNLPVTERQVSTADANCASKQNEHQISTYVDITKWMTN